MFPHTTVSSDHITITFAPDGTLEGSGGCNNYFGTYTVSGGQLTISDQLGSTQMFCEQAVMTRESLYFRLLLSVHSYQISNGNLELVYGSGSSTNPNMLTYVSTAASARPGASQLPAQVLGTAWTLKYLDSNNTSQDVSASGRMIKFEPDGTFYGSTGCNDFFGTYTVSGEKLTIGNVATTRKVCPDVDETLDSTFLQHLAAAKTYILANNGELSLDYEDTGSSLVFVRTTWALAVNVQPVVIVGMPTTGGGTPGTPMPILLLLAGSVALLATGIGLRRQVARKAVRK